MNNHCDEVWTRVTGPLLHLRETQQRWSSKQTNITNQTNSRTFEISLEITLWPVSKPLHCNVKFKKTEPQVFLMETRKSQKPCKHKTQKSKTLKMKTNCFLIQKIKEQLTNGPKTMENKKKKFTFRRRKKKKEPITKSKWAKKSKKPKQCVWVCGPNTHSYKIYYQKHRPLSVIKSYKK